MRNNTVEVIDLSAGTHLKSLPGFRERQGIAAIADATAMAVANGQGDGIQIISADDYRLLRAVPLGDDSDNVRYVSGERDIGRLKEGSFTATLAGVNAHINVSPHLQISSFVQYDTSSASFGTNSRLRWTFTPAADLFVIYNHNVRDIENVGWRLESNQFLVKVQYALRR